ncbi:MAG: PilZ domain-containing protein [Acidobacteriota bacterium]
MTEKRDAERVQTGRVRGEVTVYEPMFIQDMSDTGAQVETRFAMHLDSLHDFRLSLGARSVIVKGRIVRCQIGEVQEGAVLYRTGIEFVEPSEHALTAIRSFVEAKRLQALEPPMIVEAELADEL